jgi:hypothetical protein
MLGALSERTERHPGMSCMALIRLPRLEMIAGGHQVESYAFRQRSQTDQFSHRELFMRKHEREHSLGQR